MKTFYIEITETRKTVVPVEAETEKEAVLKALMQYKKGEVSLDKVVPGPFTMEAVKSNEDKSEQ